MRTVLLLLVASTAYIASAMPADNLVAEKTYPRYIDFPDGEGNLRKVDLEAEVDQQLIDEVTRNPANTRYFLFTRRNTRVSQELLLNNAASIRNSNYNPNLQTVVVAHGWLGNVNTDMNPAIRDAYLNRFDVNVLIVDWRRLALADYATAARGIPAVGRGVGDYINFIINNVGGNLANFHLVGFSLGAHLVGNAGRQLGGRVTRVTGLDPAGPLWVLNSDRLGPNDGGYVEAIHTDGGLYGLGIGSSIANADFYPNGGTSQPGCLLNTCNHDRAWELFASTVTNNHLVGQQCTTSLQISMNTCRGSNLPMGNADMNKSGRGDFRVNTDRRYPF